LPAVEQSLEQSLAFLAAEIERLPQQIDHPIDNTPSLKADTELLTRIPGIGEGTAQTLLAELPDVGQFPSAEQVGAWAGLCPKEFGSGSRVRKPTRLSKAGNEKLRKALSFPAVSAIGFNPLASALYERLVAAGKARMAALGAAMRKLLILCYGVLKNRKMFAVDWKKPSK